MLRVMLTLVLSLNGLQITVQAPSGCHPCYVQVDTSGGLTARPSIFQFDLAPGETFGHTVDITGRGGTARVRVWTEQSGTDADADKSITIPHRVYLPLF